MDSMFIVWPVPMRIMPAPKMEMGIPKATQNASLSSRKTASTRNTSIRP